MHALTFAFSLTTFNRPQVRRGLHPEKSRCVESYSLASLYWCAQLCQAMLAMVSRQYYLQRMFCDWRRQHTCNFVRVHIGSPIKHHDALLHACIVRMQRPGMACQPHMQVHIELFCAEVLSKSTCCSLSNMHRYACIVCRWPDKTSEHADALTPCLATC